MGRCIEFLGLFLIDFFVHVQVLMITGGRSVEMFSQEFPFLLTVSFGVHETKVPWKLEYRCSWKHICRSLYFRIILECASS